MKTTIITILMTLVTAVPLFAAAPTAKSDLLAPIAPFVNNETVAVVFVDLSRVDVDATAAELLRLVPKPLQAGVEQGMVATARRAARGMVGSLRKHGCTHLFAVVNLADIAPKGGPLVVATVADGGDLKAVATTLQGGQPDSPVAQRADRGSNRQLFEVCRPVGQVVLAGTQATVARAESLTAAPRPDFGHAAAHVNGGVAGAVVSLGDESRRVVREMFPPLPAPFQDVSGSLLADRVRWLAIGIDLKRHLTLRGVLQSSDTASAAHLSKTAQNGLTQLAAIPSVKERLPGLEKILPLVTPHIEGDRLTVTVTTEDKAIALFTQLVAQPLRTARQAAWRQQSMNNMKQLAIAMHMYHQRHKHFPPAAVRNDQGQKLLSWRVLILPYIEHEALFGQFHLDEPWDSEHNSKLIDKMPRVLACPRGEVTQKGATRYLAPVGETLAFTGGDGVPFKQFTDGTSRTILLVEADPSHAVVWTKPDDLQVDLEKPRRGLAGGRNQGFLAARADGSVHFVPKAVGATTLRAMLTRNGGEPVDR